MRVTPGSLAVPDGAITSDSFAAALAAFEPFEPSPVLAVGVSGGPDSMALALLADAWAKARGGGILGLTVDHGLRPESADEARQVDEWMSARGIAHRVLTWTGPKPESGIQNAARDARYALLAEACAAQGILHLAVAHHADDQAETILFRQQRGSGPGGLAGMSAARSLGSVRLIRPLLGFPKSALVATCQGLSQPFIDDPSNRSARYARTAARARLAADSALQSHLLSDAKIAGVRRVAGERALASLLARAVTPRPDGAVLLNGGALALAEPGLGVATLNAVLRMAGGGAHPLETEAVERLCGALSAPEFRGASLGGCLIRPARKNILICREPGRVGAPMALPVNVWRRWDGRFLVRTGRPGLTVRALGRADYAGLRRVLDSGLPSAIGAGLPAFARDGRLVAAPSLG